MRWPRCPTSTRSGNPSRCAYRRRHSPVHADRKCDRRLAAAVTRVSQQCPPPGANRLRGAHRPARPTRPRPVGQARDRRGHARPARRWPCSSPAGIRLRPPSPPCTTTPPAPGRPTHGRSSARTTTSSPSPTASAPGRRRGARPRDRGRPRPRCRRGAARDRSATRGAPRPPSVGCRPATCTTSTATCPLPRRRTPCHPSGHGRRRPRPRGPSGGPGVGEASDPEQSSHQASSIGSPTRLPQVAGWRQSGSAAGTDRRPANRQLRDW